MSEDPTTATIDSLREDVSCGINGGVHVSDFDRACANAALDEIVRRAEEAATLRTERDRLARVFAVERGDESQAPSGWVWVKAGVWRRGLEAAIERRANTLWEWSAWIDGICTPSLVGLADTALEAMEAADKARGAHHD